MRISKIITSLLIGVSLNTYAFPRYMAFDCNYQYVSLDYKIARTYEPYSTQANKQYFYTELWLKRKYDYYPYNQNPNWYYLEKYSSNHASCDSNDPCYSLGTESEVRVDHARASYWPGIYSLHFWKREIETKRKTFIHSRRIINNTNYCIIGVGYNWDQLQRD